MKSTMVSLSLITILVIAVALAGCTGSTPQQATATQTAAAGAQATQAPGGAQATTAASGSGSTAGSLMGIDKILSGVPYNWVEYKTTFKADDEDMTVFYKHDVKTGKCTMRFEGAGMEGMSGMTMDCSSQGGTQSAANPNDVGSDVKFTLIGIEPVSVPAGTYATASKYSVTSEGETMFYWTAPGVPTFVKWQFSSKDGDVITELNGWG